ncbi:HlyD family efflux transporter periplasmic adaptor subunit [uncultured Victivallis sp.]|uniref:HlyD family secretion protein n=1 Tax=uncultured Victivallis sp. TaxID=354118 RepID=UPI0025E1721D|nr:HlyD family efflux transporter periplasmic adaptor subunit [uncultured Victivallis sp.]
MKVHQGGLRGKLRLLTIIGFSLVLLVIGGIVSLFLIEIEDVIYAKGKIASEITYDVISHLDGRVIHLYFDEGDDVKKGDVIAQVDALEYEEERVRIESEIREYEAELEVKRAELEALRTNPLPKELWYAETNLRESTDKAQRTQARLNRSLKLSSNNAISKREFEDAEIENIKAQGELARARENLEMVRRGVGERNIEKAERDIDLVEVKIASRRAALKLVERRISDCRIVAPSDGRLVTLPCKYSTYVQRGELAARMSAGTTLKGIAYVDETVVRKVRIGQNVRISSGVFNRLEYGSFYGSVDRVYDTPIQDSDTNATRYPVEVTIDSQGRPLKLGSSADFAIVTGREPVIYTILNMTTEEDARREPPPREGEGG